MPAIAVSRPVNPPGASPVLTEAQVWQGLGIKARKPMEFVSMIENCEVLKDEGSHVERTVTFRNGPTLHETVDEYEPTAAYFEMETGMRVLNIVSYDSSSATPSAPEALLLTFSFVNGIPGLKPGAPRPQGVELDQQIQATGLHAVQGTIDRIRELVADGTIA